MDPAYNSRMQSAYGEADPVTLLSQLAQLQMHLWSLACPMARNTAVSVLPANILSRSSNTPATPTSSIARQSLPLAVESKLVPPECASANAPVSPQPTPSDALPEPARPKRAHRRVKREHVVHDWRTRQDPFADVCERLWLLFSLDPDRTAKDLLSQLQREQPDSFALGLLRTLQRRVRLWRREHMSCECHGDAIKIGP